MSDDDRPLETGASSPEVDAFPPPPAPPTDGGAEIPAFEAAEPDETATAAPAEPSADAPPEGAAAPAAPAEVDAPYRPEIDIVLPRLPLLVARGGLYVVVLTIAAAALWAFWARVDVVVEAPGRIVPRGEPVRVEPPITGILVEITAREGDRVAAGDVLFRIDPVEVSARTERAREEFRGVEEQLARVRATMEAVRDALEHGPTPGRIAAVQDAEIARSLGALARAEGDLSVARALAGDQEAADALGTLEAKYRLEAADAGIAAAKRALEEGEMDRERAHAAIEAARVAADESREALTGARASRAGAARLFELLAKEERTYRVLSESGAIAEVEYLERLRQFEAQRYEAERLAAAETEAAREIERQMQIVLQAEWEAQRSAAAVARGRDDVRRLEAERSLIGEEGNRRVGVAVEAVRTARGEAEQALSRLAAEEEALLPRAAALRVDLDEATVISGRTSVLAPLAGTVAHVLTQHPWAYVQPGQPVLALIPETAPLVAEVRLSNRDVAKVLAGASCRMKFEAFPYQDFGFLSGRIRSIAPDASGDTGEYRAFVDLDRTTFASPEGMRTVRPGMQLLAEIKVRERRVVEYLLEPFFKLKRRGMTVTE